MSEEETNIDPEQPSVPSKVWQGIRQGVNKAGQTAVTTSKKGAQLGSQLAQTTGQTTQTAVGKVQRRLGEDYYAIMAQNPIVLDTLSRADLLQENKLLLQTAFNIPWSSSIVWGFTVGVTQMKQDEIAHAMGQLFHYGPGHISRWNEVNRYMDGVRGGGHRLKFGHSPEYLSQIIDQFGVEGVPAFYMHLLQDFTTIDGIPFVPKAWDVKQGLQGLGFAPRTAARLVSLSFTSMMSAMFMLMWASSLWELGSALVKKRRMTGLLKTADEARKHGDYKTAASNYEKTLEIDRNPYVMMALGQVYAQHQDTRFKSHRIFENAVNLLANQPGKTMPYNQMQLSVRGMAGIQALSTVDVYEGLPQDYWNEYLSKLVLATSYSFKVAAQAQVKQSTDRIPDAVVNPAQFSAAINYYLAAKSACHYPFLKEREELVRTNLQAAQQALGLVAQYDEVALRPSVENLRTLWSYELLPPATRNQEEKADE
jgi:hypothetical protein